MARTAFSTPFEPIACRDCKNPEALGFTFTMAFQPIVDLKAGRVFAYEALVRGTDGAGAASVLARVNDSNRYRFDQACRVKAIALAGQLGLASLPGCLLSINFMPNAVYRPETCIRATLEASAEHDFPTDRLMFEVTEGEKVEDPAHLSRVFAEYKRQGFTTAIDDFGAGYAGLSLLSIFQPQVLKLDMELTRNIHQDRIRTAIVEGVLGVARALEITVIAEGVESRGEIDHLSKLGVHLFQGYFFARPAVEALPEVKL